MTRVGRRLIEDFLLPALNDQRYGERLMWVDRDKLHFSIRWSHKNAAKWSLDDTVVFQDWDKMKGHFHPDIKGYYMQSKQRFRAALYKLNTVRKLRTEDKHTKLYQLVLENDKKRSYDCSGKLKIKKEVDVLNTRPSVICRNVNYVEKNPDADNQYILPAIQIKKEIPQHSRDSMTNSDSSNNSMDQCSYPSDQCTMMSHNSENNRVELSPRDDKEEKVHHINYPCASILLSQFQTSSLYDPQTVTYQDSEHIENKCSKLSNGMLHFIPCHTQPMVIAHNVEDAVFCSPSFAHVQQNPIQVHYSKSMQNTLPNRHLPVLPSPVYSKSQPTRKNDFLLQPVDLSMKRESYDNSHIPVPVSAR